MTKKFGVIFLIILMLGVVWLFYWIFVSTSCDNDFRVYPKEGYCEFNLKTCEGAFGCKEYNNVRIPCGSEANLCGRKTICPCEKID